MSMGPLAIFYETEENTITFMCYHLGNMISFAEIWAL